MTTRRGVTLSERAVACVVLAASAGVLSSSVVAAPSRRLGAATAQAANPGRVDHLYRIVGKVRVLLFWVSADDVGGARISWRATDRDQTVALLIGSEPQRAPREVNEWGYIREHMVGDATTVFGVRTVTDGDSPHDAEARRRQSGPAVKLGVLCSTVTTSDTESRTATVYVPRDATYRHVDRVLEIVEQHASWKRRHIARPAGVAPGFLTALDMKMRSSAAAAPVREVEAVHAVPRVAYVYRDAIYDLIVRRVERVPRFRTRSGFVRNLLRTEFAVRNRATGSTTGFVIIYGTDGPLAGVPVYAQYQPNWWFRVELELDEGSDVPVDPAEQDTVRNRIDTVCGSRSGE